MCDDPATVQEMLRWHFPQHLQTTAEMSSQDVQALLLRKMGLEVRKQDWKYDAVGAYGFNNNFDSFACANDRLAFQPNDTTVEVRNLRSGMVQNYMLYDRSKIERWFLSDEYIVMVSWAA